MCLAHEVALRDRVLPELGSKRLDDDGVLQAPAAVRIGNDDVLRAGRRDDAPCARGIFVRVGANLELKAVAETVSGDACRVIWFAGSVVIDARGRPPSTVIVPEAAAAVTAERLPCRSSATSL